MRPCWFFFLASLSGIACSRPSSNDHGSTASDPIVQIAAARDLTCARTQKGNVLCWGDDAFTSTFLSANDLPAPTRTRPTAVAGIKDAMDLDVASSLGCAVDRGGAVYCWTDRTGNQRGPAPALVATAIGVTDAVGVSLGVAAMPQACVRKKDGTVTCLFADRQSLPRDEKLVSGLTQVEAVSVGDMVTCAARAGGKLSCWGGSVVHLDPMETAIAAPPLLENAKSLSAGSAFACAIDASGKVSCFGADKGEPPSQPARLVRAGVYHGCIVDTGGQVLCWGDDRFGQLGRMGPDGVEGVHDVVDVAVGEWHTCALEKSGKVLCWGRNARGQLGDGATEDRREAREVILR
jgi:alpha-tubulin suppressor-like RCC1 family protein